MRAQVTFAATAVAVLQEVLFVVAALLERFKEYLASSVASDNAKCEDYICRPCAIDSDFQSASPRARNRKFLSHQCQASHVCFPRASQSL